MEIHDLVALKFKNGPKVTMPESLILKDQYDQRWLKFRASDRSLARMVLGHLPDCPKAADLTLASNVNLQALCEQVREKLTNKIDPPEQHVSIFGEPRETHADFEDGMNEEEDGKKIVGYLAHPKLPWINIDVKGVRVRVKTPDTARMKDLIVILEPEALEAVCSFLVDSGLEDSLGKKRAYNKKPEGAESGNKSRKTS